MEKVNFGSCELQLNSTDPFITRFIALLLQAPAELHAV